MALFFCVLGRIHQRPDLHTYINVRSTSWDYIIRGLYISMLVSQSSLLTYQRMWNEHRNLQGMTCERSLTMVFTCYEVWSIVTMTSVGICTHQPSYTCGAFIQDFVAIKGRGLCLSSPDTPSSTCLHRELLSAQWDRIC